MAHESLRLSARGLRAVWLALVFGLPAASAIAADAINPDADEILRGMSKFLGAAKTFSVSVDSSIEVVTKEGQKLQMANSGSLVVERPSRAYMARHGKFADTEAFYDGKKLTFYGKNMNAYLQRDVAGTIDDALGALEKNMGIPVPAGDLLLANPYPTLTSGITASGYYGVEYVGGVPSHHLAFRTAVVDWQLWVKAEGDPLPMKYVITSKGVEGSPQFSVQFGNWNLKPKIAANRFSFTAPKGAKKLEALPVDEIGEIKITQENK
jgi:hypothetical protein